MSKTRFIFAVSFFFLATCGTLLLIWTSWWLAVIGHSVPARRPFFTPVSNVPPLVVTAADREIEKIFTFSLAGGWPRVNSALRFIAAFAAVLCSFTFAFLASLASPRVSRTIFCAGLALVAVFATLAAVVDLVALVRTARECSRNECITAVPEQVLNSNAVCECSVDAWFYFTVGTDVLLAASALFCLVLTLVPMLLRKEDEPTY